ncbi:MAG: GAF domain-containing protein [Nitrospira sp.]|nr:GAF domain-containing protein [Nitrospira sp.]
MPTTTKQIIRTTNIIALVLSVSVAILLPLGYYISSYQHQDAALKTEAEATGYFITQLINANPDFWRYSVHRLEELLSRDISHDASGEFQETRRIVDLNNILIASNTDKVEAPLITRSHNLYASGTVVAKIEISHSLRPILKNTLLFGLLGLFLGSVGYFCFKIFPLRALSNTLKLLRESYKEKKEEAETSKLLLDLVETLSTSLEEKELIRNVFEMAPRYLRFNSMGLYFYDDAAKSFALAGASGLSHSEKEMAAARTISPDDFPAIDVLMKGECVIIDDAAECVLISDKIIDAFNINSALLAPISFRGQTSGMICGIYTSDQPIEQKDTALLKGLADGLGIALQNSRLYKESNDRLTELTNKVETIKAMAQLDREILSTIDKSEILKTAAVLTSRLVPCDRVAILIRNGSNYSAIAEWGVGRFSETKYDIHRSHFNIIETRQASLSIPNISEDNVDCTYHEDQSSIGIRSSLLVPLISKDKLLGILDIGSLDYGKLTSSHLSTAEQIASQIAVALENARLYEDLEHLLVSTITSLAHTIDAKSPWTKGHSERVTGFAVEIAMEMGLNEKDIKHVKLCGILHDIGKIGTYDIVLDKPGKLTEEEFALVKKHPEKGAEIIAPIKQLREVLPGILHHHERYDGKGYPYGIKGNDIPLCASILSVADSFDSMTSDRPYRKSPGIDYAIAELKRCSGSQFDPQIVEVFLKVLKKLDETGQIPI